MKNRRSKRTAPKRRHAPKVVRCRGSAAAGRESENARLTRERNEALEQQKATGKILGVICRSPGDLQPVFDAIVQCAARLCDASNASLYRVEGDTLRHVANYGSVATYNTGEARPITSHSLGGIAVTGRKTVHVHDALALADSKLRDNSAAIKREKIRTVLAIPLLRGKAVLGVFIARRDVVRDFTDKQIELLQNFATQAVIAIENTRLFSELRQRTDDLTESLQQQTATADVLKAISRSTFDLPPVLDTLLETACRLCDADIGTIRYEEGVGYRLAATFGCRPEWREHFAGYSTKPDHSSVFGQTILNGSTVHIPDVLEDRDYARPQAQKLMGLRAALGVPLLREGRVFGVVNLFRKTPRPFTQKQIELVETFADQAVIAIENVRLFDSEQHRTLELSESLQQQTATADVLKVISRSTFDLQKVLDTLVESASRVCDAYDSIIFLRLGDKLTVKAHYGPIPVDFPDWSISRDWLTGRAFIDHAPIHVHDVQAAAKEFPVGTEMARRLGFRTTLAVPLLRENEAIGAITIRRSEVKPFTDKQIELVKTFADQAVIAIENVRLFEAEQRRTAELSEALEQQKATSDVLRVISSSPGELAPVFKALLDNAARICEAKFGMLVLAEDEGKFRVAAMHGAPPQLAEKRTREPVFTPGPSNNVAIVAKTKKVQHVADLRLDPSYLEREPAALVLADLAGARTLVVVPMLKNNEFIGAFGIYRQEVRPFTDKQIALLENFAAQAVIAIENTRLLNELRQRTNDLSKSLEQQTATSEVLQVISRSPGELEPVFRSMLENAVRICQAKFGNMFLFEDNSFRVVAMQNPPPAYAERWQRNPVFSVDDNSQIPLARLAAIRSVVHITDLTTEPAYIKRDPLMVALVEAASARTHLLVPMLKEGELVGAIVIYRQEVSPFGDKQIQLLTNFAAQAVIAIENTRLLSELRESLQQQTATGEILASISGSLTDTKPVFDAIVRNLLRLFGTRFAVVQLLQDGVISMPAADGEPEFERLIDYYPRPLDDSTVGGYCMLAKKTVYFSSIVGNPQAPIATQKFAQEFGFNSTIFAPMMRGDTVIGAIGVAHHEPRMFDDKKMALIRAFADQAVIAIENVRLFEDVQTRTRELTEALEQQTATSEVLKVISSSPGDLEPVFQAMLANAVRICEAKFGLLFLWEADAFRTVALHGAPPALAELRRREPVLRPTPGTALERVAATKQTVQIADVQAEPSYQGDPARRAGIIGAAGARTLISVPMVKEDTLVGTVSIYRQEVRPFTDKQIELVTNFAAQAVIAIENARLLKELRQRTDDLSKSLERQTATSEVLKVISSSPGDLEPVFQAMLENATRGAKFAHLLLFEDGAFRRVALYGGSPAWAEVGARAPAFRPSATNPISRLVRTKQVVNVPDMAAEQAYHERDPGVVALVERAGARTIIAVPMLKENELVGAIAIYRQELRPFTDKQIELVTNFAAQAVIAIENTRLLSELRQRTDDLSESLEQQTATSEVLQVISQSPGELPPVFEALLANATRLCEASHGAMWLREGEAFRVACLRGDLPAAYLDQWRSGTLLRPGPNTPLARVTATRQPVYISDMREDAGYLAGERLPVSAVEVAGIRTLFSVPMLRENEVIGAIAIYRTEVRQFSDKQIQLLTNFAAQAVIAIENTRLLSELRQSLQQQTASADVLKVISSSPTDVKPVFDTIGERAKELCDAEVSVVSMVKGDLIELASVHGVSAEGVEAVRRVYPMRRDNETITARTVRAGDIVHVADVLTDPQYETKYTARVAGYRACLGVPMVREGQVIGTIFVARTQPGYFADSQVQLLKIFADQAVIAIGNVQLFDEVQARTEDLQESLQQQTATADVLKVISRSTFDLKMVLNTLLQSAARLCEADRGTITQRKGDTYYRSVSYGFPPAFAEYVKDRPVEPGRDTGTGRALLEGKVIHIPDVQADPDYTWKEAQRLGGFRTMLGVPMLREGVPVGVLTLTRSEVRPFTAKQIELVSTFADQAAIAIENVRLFESVEARTRELAKSLEELRTAQDRLIQTEKLASLGQLTAGIAHEIKNPLNFVNNFSAISVELIDELREALAGAKLDDKLRAQVAEVADMLQGNLAKVVQHGKRADSIVKNMLLHSRQGSGEHRPIDINAVVEESLNLAYHGARAEKQGFNITLERSLDPTAGEVDLFPQEITRVLLNLISNGFYAATKRKAETNGGGYEPTLAAATKNLGDSVEIRIRDNGTGIPPEVRERMFNPFFTTKPAGEGTGLGLSISHDIIVKQHAGSIEVDTQPGEFTEFRIVLPRGAASIAKAGESA